MNAFSAHTAAPTLAIISAMITPAILILASGNLVASTLQRLGRIVDRSRALVDRLEAQRPTASVAASRAIEETVRLYRRRALFVSRALSAYYAAIGLFIVTSLTIALDNVMQNTAPWLAVALTVSGVLLLLLGTVALVIETNIAAHMLSRELDDLGALKR